MFSQVKFYRNQQIICFSLFKSKCHSKRFKTQKYYLSNGIIDNCNLIINEKNSYDQPIDSGIKRYEEIRKLTRAQGGHYTTGCLLDYDYIKNHYRLIAVDLKQILI